MIKILVDSASDYSMQEIRQTGLEYAPLHISNNDYSFGGISRPFAQSMCRMCT